MNNAQRYKKNNQNLENYLKEVTPYGTNFHYVEDTIRYYLTTNNYKISDIEIIFICRILYGRKINASEKGLDLRHCKAILITISCIVFYLINKRNVSLCDINLKKIVNYYFSEVKNILLGANIDDLSYVDGIHYDNCDDLMQYLYCYINNKNMNKTMIDCIIMYIKKLKNQPTKLYDLKLASFNENNKLKKIFLSTDINALL